MRYVYVADAAAHRRRSMTLLEDAACVRRAYERPYSCFHGQRQAIVTARRLLDAARLQDRFAREDGFRIP